MTVSRALKSAVYGVAVLWLVIGTAQAQLQLIPGATPPPPPANTPPTSPSQTPTDVAVESLDNIDVEAIGALPIGTKALPPDLWKGLSRGSVAALIDAMPGNWSIPAARSLAERVLLSPATMPPAEADIETGVILSARISALLRVGAVTQAAELALVGQDILAGSDAQSILTHTKLSTFDVVGACKDAGRFAPDSADIFWQKLLIFCQAVAGQKDGATLGATTLLDLGVEDPVFFALIEDIGLGLTADLRDLSPEGPLHYAMLRFAGARLATEPQDAAIAALAVEQDDDANRAEMALAKGLVSFAIVAEKYRATRFKASALENPIGVVTLDRLSFPARRALLFQAIAGYESPALKAEAIAAALEQSKTDGRLAVAAMMFVDQARAIPPSGDLLWFAEDAARLFYLTGDVERGAAWHALIRAAGATDQNAAAADSRLWHLAVLSGQSGPALTRSRSGWEAAIGDGLEAPALRIAALTALVEAAMGTSPVGSDWQARQAAMMLSSSVSDAPGAAPLLLQRLTEASLAGHIGETVTLSLAALAPLEADDLDIATVTLVVAALRRVGLETDARRLALEAAVLSEQTVQ